MKNTSTYFLCAFIACAAIMTNTSVVNAEERVFYIGTQALPTPSPDIEVSRGIYRGVFNDQTGEIKILGLAAEARNPSFVVKHPTLNCYYSDSGRGIDGQGSVDAWEKQADGSLKKLNSQRSGGQGPCHLSVHPNGKCLFVANYSGGQAAMIQILPDGSLGEVLSDQHVGYGPNTVRQERAHVHWMGVDPTGKRVLCCDLGCDKVYSMLLDENDFGWIPNPKFPFAQVSSGAGCRHAIFSADGKYLFVLNELSSTIDVFLYDSQSGSMTVVQSDTTLPKEFRGTNKAAAICDLKTEDGEFVYCSNRGANLLTVFKVNPGEIRGDREQCGTVLETVQHITSGGNAPRFVGIDPTGKFLLSCNKKTCNIVVYAIDQKTGKLTPTGFEANVGWPLSIAWE